MIKRLALCPYCRAGVIGLDYESMELIFNPDTAGQQPCPHLVCIHGIYCFGGVLADRTTQAGMARLHWRQASFADVAPEELGALAEKAAPGSEMGPRGSPDQVLCFQDLEIREKCELSGADRTRWYEQVGWEKAAELDLPYQEHNVLGWVVFARRPAELMRQLSGAALRPAG